MKIMEKSSSEKGHWSNESMFRREVQVLGLLNHPHIIRYYDFYEDRHFLYAVMEKCDGGELFESILRHRTFPERRAAQLCFQMLRALAYVHSCGVVHRDIKAENFLFKTTHPDSPLKLIDFGMSARISKEQLLTDVCGSPHYLSPELIRRKYSFKADVWALGVLIYLMLFGRYPFDGNNTSAIVKVILTKKIDWQCGEIRPSERAIHFMKTLLQRNPEKRPTASEACQHAWLSSARRNFEMQEQLSARRTVMEDLQEELLHSEGRTPRSVDMEPQPESMRSLMPKTFEKEEALKDEQLLQPTEEMSPRTNLMPNVRSAYRKLTSERRSVPINVELARNRLLAKLEEEWRTGRPPGWRLPVDPRRSRRAFSGPDLMTPARRALQEEYERTLLNKPPLGEKSAVAKRSELRATTVVDTPPPDFKMLGKETETRGFTLPEPPRHEQQKEPEDNETDAVEGYYLRHYRRLTTLPDRLVPLQHEEEEEDA
eukprot:Gregarina_sp_Pseudo_9__5935@NODE_953_length_2036_cov_3_994992_g894_i0_p1_GENE_NODE_953_length_2036_cov_3_994992_g894_i0NODE_953_length_2036_cov_3_994992_g894_i0_p1_ORF_typecomplete_len553_score79_60Pkinase/PF00069_25/8_9e76Pkinase_Tyr/PF07714_17/3_4e47Kinaselike/PF14531_6/7_9e19Kdo/PF06293_14/2_8e11Pkinase_fungal/PF17667_1/2_4e08RIO1/PF01163_22/8_6e06YrbLPhoP_reg/PF10707_9/2_1e05YrbLPhoP_reg/PF10707_9/5_3e03APH/PF01636_23/2_8e05APH/PF01636_23/2_9e03WaaY/PF06176_11/8_9e05FTA2/PF13095_6/6e03FTA2/P